MVCCKACLKWRGCGRARGAAVTHGGGGLCVSDLIPGATTRVALRAGIPDEDELPLLCDGTMSVAMANRLTRIDFRPLARPP